jgi:diguanylate cyclase (GGDEF)-like protein/PAS domain S-box-containing protein
VSRLKNERLNVEIVLRYCREHILLILALAFMAGLLLAWAIVDRADREMREELLVQARLVALAINPDRVAALKGVEADSELDDYNRLQEQLAAILTANDQYRFIYLMGRNANRDLFFYVDSEPSYSEDHSPPGEIYPAASSELIAMFDDGRSFVEGPLIDDFGVWVSALVPLYDPESDGTTVVLGIDIDAGTWRYELAKRALLPVGLMFSMLVIFASGLYLVRSQAELHESEEKYEILFANSPDAYLIITDGVFSDCNKAAEEMFKSKRHEILGKTPGNISPPVQPNGKYSPESSMENIETALQKGHFTFEWVHCRPGGDQFWVEVSLSPMYIRGRQLLFAACRDITDRKSVEEKINFMSYHDSLTGLYNRRYLEEEMKRLDTARQLPISLIMADLNGLKLVNDTYGHRTGDQMLRLAADILKSACREEDILVRWGGDEFIILLPQTSKEEALEIGKRINDFYKDASVKNIPVSIALGVSAKQSPEYSIRKLLKEAEDNMYKVKLTESRSTKSAVLGALLKALAAKSFETNTHTGNMQEIALKIGREMNLPESELRRLTLLITLHDIGKINIPEEILTKESPLTAEEWEIIRKHPEIGYRIALATEEFAHVAEDVLSHHERWDGSGYPRGLKGLQITMLARITAVADAFEVMTNGRPYKKAMSPDAAIEELKRSSGSHFDPTVVETFLSIIENELNLDQREA